MYISPTPDLVSLSVLDLYVYITNTRSSLIKGLSLGVLQVLVYPDRNVLGVWGSPQNVAMNRAHPIVCVCVCVCIGDVDSVCALERWIVCVYVCVC